jgi:multimeric flavodoxin WrbA
MERKLIMKKVTAFVGSAHRKNTHKAVVQFLENLEALGDVECEIVTLSKYDLGICRGCRLCFERGEEYCPLKDDRDVLMEKIEGSDGIIFATPNYSFQVSGLMKVFLDRFGYVFHRPRYFGKAFTSIVVQGIGGGGKLVSYLDFVGSNLGFNTLKGSCITALDPRTEKDQQKIDRTLAKQSMRFHKILMRSEYPIPTLFKLMLFRMGRTSIKQMLDERSCDYRYYAEKGWLESDYYYPTRMGLLKKVAGNLFDSMASVVRSMLA